MKYLGIHTGDSVIKGLLRRSRSILIFHFITLSIQNHIDWIPSGFLLLNLNIMAQRCLYCKWCFPFDNTYLKLLLGNLWCSKKKSILKSLLFIIYWISPNTFSQNSVNVLILSKFTHCLIFNFWWQKIQISILVWWDCVLIVIVHIQFVDMIYELVIIATYKLI